MKKVFISYSSKDKQLKDELVNHLKITGKDSLEIWDDSKNKFGDKWEENIKNALHEADAAILLISEYFLNSDFIMKEEIPIILERNEKVKMKIFPLYISACSWKSFGWLKNLEIRPKGEKSIKEMAGKKRDNLLMKFAEEIKEVLTEIKINEGRLENPKEIKISLSKLPHTEEGFFGRNEEIKTLFKAWEDKQTYILSIVAMGGGGKSSLVKYWLNHMELENYKDAEKVYGWTFDGQGSEDNFFRETLNWFGYRDTENIKFDNRGTRLATLVQKSKTLLILDGLESLQYAPGDSGGEEGKLKNPEIRTFLTDLASQQHHGLCIITSRLRLMDLDDKVGFKVKQLKLGNLPVERGVELLKWLGVKGNKYEMKKIVKEYRGYPLSLRLLGKYLYVVCDGKIPMQNLTVNLLEDEKDSRDVHRVMEWYSKCLSDPENSIIYLMVLFDQSVPEEGIDALRKYPAIKGVTESIQDFSNEKWKYTLQRLIDKGLMVVPCQNESRIDTLDCHPLIRLYFRKKFKELEPEGFRLANERLYHYYLSLQREAFPDTLEEMKPLISAIKHGCSAGIHQEVFTKLYQHRILREYEGFIFRSLGAFSTDLEILLNFFKEPLQVVSTNLDERSKALVLNGAAFDLRALGRLREAKTLMKKYLETKIQNADWENAAIAANNLSEMELLSGNVSKAIEYASGGVEYARKSRVDYQLEARLATLAYARFISGNLNDAEEKFLEAERIFKKRHPEYPYLYSIRGFQYCELLLEQGKFNDVKARAKKNIDIVSANRRMKENEICLYNALARLSCGCALMMEIIISGGSSFVEALDLLNMAVEGLRKSNNTDDLPRGLLARAKFYRLMGNWTDAWKDLNEVRNISETFTMNLYMADYYLEVCRLYFKEGQPGKAKKNFKNAERLINETGYKLREKELEELKMR